MATATGTDTSDRVMRGWQFAVGSSILGWVLDAFDFFVVVFLFDTLAERFHVSKASVVYTLTLTLAMRPLGGQSPRRLLRRSGGTFRNLLHVPSCCMSRWDGTSGYARRGMHTLILQRRCARRPMPLCLSMLPRIKAALSSWVTITLGRGSDAPELRRHRLHVRSHLLHLRAAEAHRQPDRRTPQQVLPLTHRPVATSPQSALYIVGYLLCPERARSCRGTSPWVSCVT